METKKDNIQASGIAYSCYATKSREGEHFVQECTFTYQIAGSLVLNDGNQTYISNAGAFRLVRRNQLLKFIKEPPENGEFRSLTIFLNQQTLKDFSLEYGINAEQKQYDQPVLDIEDHVLLHSYFQSLMTYHQTYSFDNPKLVQIKMKEAILLLLQINPELKNVLFDFTEPHKIDLENFMNKNYHFNVHLERFAYLTGRSLATFKRDFEKTFNTTPGRWLLHKRLQEAYYLLKEKGKAASDIYLELGFEDLSHFSFAFKKAFGEAPSKIMNRYSPVNTASFNSM